MQSLTRRTFAKLFAAAAATVVAPILAATKPGAVGVYHGVSGKVAYRVFRIL
jgi:hypothetical protein